VGPAAHGEGPESRRAPALRWAAPGERQVVPAGRAHLAAPEYPAPRAAWVRWALQRVGWVRWARGVGWAHKGQSVGWERSAHRAGSARRAPPEDRARTLARLGHRARSADPGAAREGLAEACADGWAPQHLPQLVPEVLAPTLPRRHGG